MKGNAGEYRGIQGNARGTYGSGCKVPGECWECRWMPRERMGVGVNCQGNAVNAGECRECRGMPGERMGVGV